MARFGFSDAAGNVGVLEQMPGRQIWLDGGRDSIGHANMIVSPEPADRALDCYPTRCPSAGARHHRVNAALTERRGAFDVAGGFAILSDQKDHPKSICRETTEVDGILTNSAIVAEPLAGRLHVTYGPADAGGAADGEPAVEGSRSTDQSPDVGGRWPRETRLGPSGVSLVDGHVRLRLEGGGCRG